MRFDFEAILRGEYSDRDRKSGCATASDEPSLRKASASTFWRLARPPASLISLTPAEPIVSEVKWDSGKGSRALVPD